MILAHGLGATRTCCENTHADSMDGGAETCDDEQIRYLPASLALALVTLNKLCATESAALKEGIARSFNS